MPSQLECGLFRMQQGIAGRGALTAPKRGEPARRERRIGKPARAARSGLLRVRIETNNCEDCSDDTIAIREQPTGEREDRNRDGSGARQGCAKSEEHRAAKGIVEVPDRRARQSRIEEFHQRHREGREKHRCYGEERRTVPSRCGRRRKRSIGRRLAAEPQPVQRHNCGEYGGNRPDQPA